MSPGAGLTILIEASQRFGKKNSTSHIMRRHRRKSSIAGTLAVDSEFDCHDEKLNKNEILRLESTMNQSTDYTQTNNSALGITESKFEKEQCLDESLALQKLSTYTLNFDEENLSDQLIRHANRMMVTVYCYFCRIDLFNYHQEASDLCETKQKPGSQAVNEPTISINFKDDNYHGAEHESTNKRSKRRQSDPISRRDKSPLWSKLVFTTYCFIVLHIAINLYYQYLHDYYSLRLRKFKSYVQHRHSADINHSHITYLKETLGFLQLGDNILMAKDTLKRIGCPHGQFEFGIEVIYIFFLGVSLLCYQGGHYIFNYWIPFDFYCLRLLVDPVGEQRSMFELVKRQVNSYLVSSRNHSSAMIHLMKQHFAQQQLRQRLIQAPIRSNSVRRATLALEQAQELYQFNGVLNTIKRSNEESRSSKQLREFFYSGRLFPINFSSDWIKSRARFYYWLNTLCIIYAVFLDLVLDFLLFAFIDPDLKHMSRIDLVFLAELIILLTIDNVTTLFYITTQLFACIDQIRMCCMIERLVCNCIKNNTFMFEVAKRKISRNQQTKWQSLYPSGHLSGDKQTRNLVAERRPSMINEKICRRKEENYDGKFIDLPTIDQSVQDKMNASLLLALMQYRIFIAQMKPLKRSFRVISITTVVIFFFLPIVGRLHTPYFDVSLDDNFRLSIVILCIIIVVPIDLCLVPLCVMHSRCLDVYKSLYRLLAHATQIQSDKFGSQVYDFHTISMLRKELDYPERSTTKFATKFAQMAFNFNTLVKLHFYYGLIVLSIIIESTTHRNATEIASPTLTIFNDPFRLLR